MLIAVQFHHSIIRKFARHLPGLTVTFMNEGLIIRCVADKDQLDRVRAVRANSNLTQTAVLDTQPLGCPN